MATYNKTGYFYIGLFTLVGLFLLAAALMILSSKAAYKNAVYAETYFNESVQGLTVGSPVKYRGMEVGKIIDISAIKSIYDISEAQQKSASDPTTPSKYIYVKMAINPRHFKGVADGNIKKGLEQEIKNGLRVKISVQGLTGNAYLELDYIKAGSSNVLPIEWQPENYYIPSSPSTLSFFSDNAQYLVGELKKVEFQKTFASIKQLTDTSKQTFNDMDKLITTYNHQTIEILMNLQAITQNLKTISERAKNNPSSVLFGDPPPKLDPSKL